MANKKMWLGMLVMVLVFGLTVVGCGNGSTGGGPDSSFNGTWVCYDDYVNEEYLIKMDNGNRETFLNSTPMGKERYSTSDGVQILIATAVYGSSLPERLSNGYEELINIELEPKWYSKDDLDEIAFEGMSDERLGQLREDIEFIFRPEAITYSVNGKF